MATRTSASVGMMVTLAIFALLSLALFVLTIVFFARTQRLTADLANSNLALEVAVRPAERNDRWEELQNEARRENKGVVKFLDDQLADMKILAAGNRRTSVEAITEAKSELLGPDAPSLMDASRDQLQRNDRQADELGKINEALNAANIDLQAEVERVRGIEDEHQKTVDALTSEIGGYKARIDGYREEVSAAKREMDERVDNIRGDLEDRIAELESDNNSLDAELRIAQAQLREFRTEKANETLRAENEGALVDGAIIGINAPAREVYIDRGRRHRVVLGMTFEIYDDGASIKVDPSTGQYPRGKATVEVIRISENSSTARILFERRGNPIVEGDALANAIYDPEKIYSFTVFGNFDVNGDGLYTKQELQDIRGIITSWGGTVTDDISGDTDFVVLGSRPILPPEPKSGDPIEVIQHYLDLSTQATQYDRLFEVASQTGIPVLNKNRLATLTGLHARR